MLSPVGLNVIGKVRAMAGLVAADETYTTGSVLYVLSDLRDSLPKMGKELATGSLSPLRELKFAAIVAEVAEILQDHARQRGAASGAAPVCDGSPLASRNLISGRLFDRLAARITVEHGFPRILAERIMEQALAFLAASATHSGASLVPCELVDIGWHTFILYTRDYAEFCQRMASRFIHHVPHESDTPGDTIQQAAVRTRTLAAITSAGYVVDVELWASGAAKCDPDKCSASGVDGNENTETQVSGP
jgi:hypothetical protein